MDAMDVSMHDLAERLRAPTTSRKGIAEAIGCNPVRIDTIRRNGVMTWDEGRVIWRLLVQRDLPES